MSIERLTDPGAVSQALLEFDRLGRTGFLAKYGFGRAREYMLRTESGALYDSKAIVGAAFGYQYPDEGPLTADVFSGGEATVARKLRDLGFDVVQAGQDWSREEVQFAVADYLRMLELEARGEPFNKSEHNAELRRRLTSRSKGSVELKHQNISAVLDELGLPFIRGYKPRTNVQELLRTVVREQIERNRVALTRVVDNFEAVKLPREQNFVGVLVEPPRPEAFTPGVKRPRLPRRLDYASRDERNRNLGHSGERWVMGYEGTRLTDLGRPDLVPRVNWVSEEAGDGAGYDIKSFSDADEDRYIEVKTTNGGPLTAFIISANELSFSEEAGDAFFLYRVFEFSESPHLFMLRGDLKNVLSLAPIDYRARLNAAT